MVGPLHGLTVVEIAHPFCAFAGKLLADAGADVILVEPPEGAEQRTYEPFAERRHVAAGFIADSELSLAWWADNTSKRSVVADLDTGPGRQFFRQLVAEADILLEAERPGLLADRGIDYTDLTGQPLSRHRSSPPAGALGPPPVNEQLIQVSITPLGRVWRRPVSEGHRHAEMTDLTIMARGGPMAMCGYDDHTLAPMRSRGDQGIRTACHVAVMATMTALLARDAFGGQFLDVSMVAAANVTTEAGSHGWLASQQKPYRQTGRHARPSLTEPAQVECADGRYLNTGAGARSGRDFDALLAYLTELELVDEAGPDMIAALEHGGGYEDLTMDQVGRDPDANATFKAGRRAMRLIGQHLTAHEAFLGLQSRGIACGVVWSADEMMQDPHFVDRGFPTDVYQPQLDREVTYPGPPIRFTKSPMSIRNPAPRLGEHTDDVRRQLR